MKDGDKMIKGKNPNLLNVTYIRPDKKRNQQECFQVIYKTEDGEVHYSDEPPNADIYIVKPEYRNYNYNKPQERIEHMDKITVPISQIRRAIADAAGEWGEMVVKRAEQQHNFRMLNELYKWPYCYGCDFQPEYYYYRNWYEKYKLGTPKLTKAFLDIETDMMDYIVDMSDIPNSAFSPVNLITVILEDTSDVYTFVLKPYEPHRLGRDDIDYAKRYKYYEKQKAAHEKMMSNISGMYNTLHKEFDEVYGELNYHIRDYDKEIDLIADVFRLLNTRKPNYCMMWNMRFDIQYLFHRIKALGYDPASVMCHWDFKNPRCSFREDHSTYLLEKQFDFFYCSSYTQYICQMRLYASIRKSQHKLRSVSLNAIGDRELHDRKVEYPEETNIITFPYEDWIRFIIYNIKDVLLQKGIERKTSDVMTYYTRSQTNVTPYNKIFRETHLLRNVREKYFEIDGWVQGNNLNILGDYMDESEKRFYGEEDDDDDESEATFKGAINAEPLMNDYVGESVLGIPSNNVFANSMDYDMGAFYPSIKIASNMDPGTLLYKGSFINEEFISGEYLNRSLNDKYEEKDKNGNIRQLDITGEAVNTYVSHNMLTFGFNYFGLPDIADMYSEVMSRLAIS